MIIYTIIGIIYLALMMRNMFVEPNFQEDRDLIFSVWFGWPMMILLWLVGAALWPIFIVVDMYGTFHNSKESPT